MYEETWGEVGSYDQDNINMITNLSKDYVSGTYNLDKCLVKAYKHQTKEINRATGMNGYEV